MLEFTLSIMLLLECISSILEGEGMDEEQNKSLMSIYQSLPSEIQCAVLWIVHIQAENP